jgi:glycosyltransferase involved in cell wall biosynthesis
MVLQAQYAARELGFKDIVLLLQWEYGLPFIKGLKPSFVCYDRLDDHPNLPHNASRRKMVAGEENAIIQASRLVTAVSPELIPRNDEAWISKSHVLPPGVDVHMIRLSMSDPAASMSPLLEGRPRPFIGYHGNLTEYRLDLELIAGLAQGRRNWTWILVGPQEKNNQKLRALAQRPNVILPGFVPHDEVFRSYVRWFDVLLLPYASEGRFLGPTMKSGEYLATGKPIVSSYCDLFEDYGKRGLFRLARSLDEFESAIEAALKEDDRLLQRERIEEAEKLSWRNRASKLLTLIKEYQA